MLALIVEDDVIQLNGIAAVLGKEFPDIQFLKAADYETARELIKQEKMDLFLLDIELDKETGAKSGLDLGTEIRSLPAYETTPILFITAIAAEAPRAIHATHCYDFLVKPYDHMELISSVRKLLQSPYMTQETPLDFKGTDGIYFRLVPSDIYYIQSDRRLIHIYCSNFHYTTIQYRLDALMALLPDYFKRCHKSYIFNTKHVAFYDKQNSFIGILDTKIPVGKTYRSSINKEFHV